MISEAEDVLQETWVRAYEHLEQFAHRASLSTWVTRIAFHEALAHVRKSNQWTPIENDRGDIMPEANRLHGVSETPESQAIRSQLGRILGAFVDALPDLYRSVFMLREVEQLSTTETAECLGLSGRAVKTRLHRSRALLQRELKGRIGPVVPQTYSILGTRCDRVVAAVLGRTESRHNHSFDEVLIQF